MTATTTSARDASHHQNIFKSMKDLDFNDTISHQCGVTMNDSVEARAIAEFMGKKDGVSVTYQPALILSYPLIFSRAKMQPQVGASLRRFSLDEC